MLGTDRCAQGAATGRFLSAIANSDAMPGRAVRSMPLAFACGAAVGVLGDMIGLGGAEFRLPLLIGVFGFTALAAVILNKGRDINRRNDPPPPVG